MPVTMCGRGARRGGEGRRTGELRESGERGVARVPEEPGGAHGRGAGEEWREPVRVPYD